ncbi:CocE/NonD family hydrolase [Chloroflexota bacterium]
MRDGVRLATDIHLPAKNGKPVEGKLPTLLNRTPYSTRGPAIAHEGKVPPFYDRKTYNRPGIPIVPTNGEPEFFARRGYAVVLQNVRGRFGSEGEFNPYINDDRDGYDCIEWAAKQPWSNSCIGTYGSSYGAMCQGGTALLKPPHLKALFFQGGSLNYHADTEGTAGAFRLAHNLLYSLFLASEQADSTQRAWFEECEEHLEEWLKKSLSKQIEIFEDVPTAKKWYKDWVDHQDFDDYWKQGGYCSDGHYDQYPDVPIYRYTGYYNMYHRSSLVAYKELKKLHKSPVFLHYGPGCYGLAGDAEYGPEYPSNDQRERMVDEQLRFFDQFLKEIETGLLDEPKVKVYVIGGGRGMKSTQGRMIHGGRWRLEEDWPLPQTKFAKYHLHSDGALKPEPPKESAATTSYSFDPNDPVPTIGGLYSYPREMSGPRDQTCSLEIFGCKDTLPISSRLDVLSFVTPRLEEDMELVGPVTVKLWASSSALDTDFTAKLIDWCPPNAHYPHGFALGLTDSIIRARYRESFEKQVLMQPGTVYEFTIDLWSVCNLFKAGHRIRLDISSSNFPALDVNPNTGERIGYHTGTVVAYNTIYHDAEHPSHIVLPVIPKGM